MTTEIVKDLIQHSNIPEKNEHCQKAIEELIISINNEYDIPNDCCLNYDNDSGLLSLIIHRVDVDVKELERLDEEDDTYEIYCIIKALYEDDSEIVDVLFDMGYEQTVTTINFDIYTHEIEIKTDISELLRTVERKEKIESIVNN